MCVHQLPELLFGDYANIFLCMRESNLWPVKSGQRLAICSPCRGSISARNKYLYETIFVCQSTFFKKENKLKIIIITTLQIEFRISSLKTIYKYLINISGVYLNISGVYLPMEQPINHCDILLRCRHRSLVASPAPPADNTQKQGSSVQNCMFYSIIDVVLWWDVISLQFIRTDVTLLTYPEVLT